MIFRIYEVNDMYTRMSNPLVSKAQVDFELLTQSKERPVTRNLYVFAMRQMTLQPDPRDYYTYYHILYQKDNDIHYYTIDLTYKLALKSLDDCKCEHETLYAYIYPSYFKDRPEEVMNFLRDNINLKDEDEEVD